MANEDQKEDTEKTVRRKYVTSSGRCGGHLPTSSGASCHLPLKGKALGKAFGGDTEKGDMATLNVRQLGWCILLEPVGDSKDPMWFSEWLKHRPDQPKHILEWLDKAGVRPGESAPMFVPANRACMVFQYKGMAEKTAEKIAAWCSDFEGKLHVMPFDEVLDDDEDEEG